MPTTLLKLLFLPLIPLAAGCGSEEPGDPMVSISLVDDVDPLTDGPRLDTLFTITLDSASRRLRIGHVSVNAILEDGPSALQISHADTSLDGYLDVGESLLVGEGRAEQFDTTHIGQTLDIEFTEDVGEEVYVRAIATWMAK